MNDLFATFVTALAAFVATNIDDIFILTVLFSQRSASFRSINIVAGQYLGFAVLLAISALGMFGGMILPREWIGLLGLAPIYMGLRKLFARSNQTEDKAAAVNKPESQQPKFASFLSPATYGVAAITVANGGDNISVYVPLFANAPTHTAFTIFIIFFLLIGLWCYAGFKLASHPAIAQAIRRGGTWLVPIVLIGLGAYIIAESGAASLLDIG